MPRTTTLEPPGCPPIRVLTFDTLGLVKVLESHQDSTVPKVVERWGNPDSSKSIIAVSIDDQNNDSLLAVARRGSQVELLNPVNGLLLASLQWGTEDKHDNTVGLHLFKQEGSNGSRKLLNCTVKGKASIWPIEMSKAAVTVEDSSALALWNVCDSGDIEVSKVSTTETHALFGGKGVEINIYDVEKKTKAWVSKVPPKDSLGIFTPTWFTSAAFMSDHQKFAAGTSNHEIRIYDTASQRRPVMSIGFRDSSIRAVANDTDGTTIYAGNASGDLASFDIRTGKMLGCFTGKCSGSIRDIVRHPELNVLASCGLDGFLRLWDCNTRQPLSAVFLKHYLNCVVFDCNYGSKIAAVDSPKEGETLGENACEVNGGKEIKKRKGKKMNGSMSKLKKRPVDLVV